MGNEINNIIHLLPDEVCNQIAAGEVIQRPASVVKELLDNSLDALSKNIKLIIIDEGKSLISVIDDGIGMSDTDARMSLEKHATSKIHSSQDLYSINTMGFRGEAIASIIAVSQTEIITKTQYNQIGTKLVVEGSEVKSQNPIMTNTGTIINVKNIFYNVPVRRNFLKSSSIERKHIINEFINAALSRPDISFSMIDNEKTLYNLTNTTLNNRITDIFGKYYKDKIIYIEDKANDIKIHGYIGNPSIAKKYPGIQYIYVNNRLIKSNQIQKIIISGYEGLINENYIPFYIIYIQVPSNSIDVNIHPTKTEIRFSNEEFLYTFIKHTIVKSLSKTSLPEITFQNTNNSINNISNVPKLCSNATKINKGIKINHEFRNYVNNLKNNDNHNIKDNQRPLFEYNDKKLNNNHNFDTLRVKNDSNIQNDNRNDKEIIEATNMDIIQVKEGYIVTTVKSGLLIIDIKRAYERILYDKYMNMDKIDDSQQILFPVNISISPQEYQLIKKYKDEFNRIGIDYEISDDYININRVPISIINQDISNIFHELLSELIDSSNTDNQKFIEKINNIVAKKISSKMNLILTKEEMGNLIDNLFACDNSSYTPNGYNIWKILNNEEILTLIDK